MPVLNKYEQAHKAYIKAEARLAEVREELRKLPLRLLEEPFQLGWEITIRLRDDIARRSDAPQILEAIRIGYQPRSFVHKLTHLKKLRAGEKGYWDRIGKDRCWITYYPAKIRLKIKEYEQLPEILQKYFALHVDSTTHYGKVYTQSYYTICLPDYYTTLRARPNMITHHRIKGGPLEAEEAELNRFLSTYWREWFGYGKDPYDRQHQSERTEIRAKLSKVLKGDLEAFD
jgi:hypothetical protein